MDGLGGVASQSQQISNQEVGETNPDPEVGKVNNLGKSVQHVNTKSTPGLTAKNSENKPADTTIFKRVVNRFNNHFNSKWVGISDKTIEGIKSVEFKSEEKKSEIIEKINVHNEKLQDLKGLKKERNNLKSVNKEIDLKWQDLTYNGDPEDSEVIEKLTDYEKEYLENHKKLDNLNKKITMLKDDIRENGRGLKSELNDSVKKEIKTVVENGFKNKMNELLTKHRNEGVGKAKGDGGKEISKNDWRVDELNTSGQIKDLKNEKVSIFKRLPGLVNQKNNIIEEVRNIKNKYKKISQQINDLKNKEKAYQEKRNSLIKEYKEVNNEIDNISRNLSGKAKSNK